MTEVEPTDSQTFTVSQPDQQTFIARQAKRYRKKKVISMVFLGPESNQCPLG